MASKQTSNAVKNALQEFLRLKKSYDEHSSEKGSLKYQEEFNRLQQLMSKQKAAPKYAALQGAEPHNYRKNRYKDILPYDYTRVVLEKVNDILGEDYINANYITGAQDHIVYVAAQGPLPHTVKDFWRLLWEQKTKVILMACSEYEGDPPKLKCERYWAQNMEEVMQFDNITVTLEKEIESGCKDYVIRYLRVERGREVHMIHQFQYVVWPDHGVPSSVTPIIDMITKARTYQADDSTPILVHCSAGCGRTGTIIAIDIVWSMLKLGKLQNFSLFTMIKNIRKQRPALVQSIEQYKFVYEVIAEIFERQLDIIKKHGYENVVIPAPRKPPLAKTNSGPKPVVPEKPKSIVTSSNESLHSSTGNRTPDQNLSPSSSELKAKFENLAVQAAPKSPVKPSVSPKLTVCPLSPKRHEPIAQIRTKTPALQHQQPNIDFETDTYSLATKDTDTESEEDVDPVDASVEDDETMAAEAYAYADPFQKDKWSLQHVALGESISEETDDYSEVISPIDECPEEEPEPFARIKSKRTAAPAYEDIDNPGQPIQFVKPPTRKPRTPAYEDVDVSDDENAPDLPKRQLEEEKRRSADSSDSKHTLSTIGKLVAKISTNKSTEESSHDGKTKKIKYKGKSIGFPNRGGNPKGPRGYTNV